jgi:hypothetical protein
MAIQIDEAQGVNTKCNLLDMITNIGFWCSVLDCFEILENNIP